MSQDQTKMLRCNRCGHVQPRNEAVCKNCGEDLMLYGEFITVTKSDSAYSGDNIMASLNTGKSSGDSSEKKSRKPRDGQTRQKQPKQKKTSGRRFPKLLIGLICVAVLLVIGIVQGIQGGDSEGPEMPIGTSPTGSAPAQPAQNAVLPDFAAYAGDLVDDSAVSSEDGVNTYIFANTTGTDLRTVFDQYRGLLESSYSYQLLGNAEKSDENITAEYYVYRYTGPDAVPKMPKTFAGEEQLGGGNVWVTYMYNQDGTAVAIDTVDAIPLVDNGDRAGTSSGTNPGGSTTPPATTPPVTTQPVTTPPVTTQPASGSAVTVTGSADFSSYNQLPANALPDLVPWSNGQATYRSEPTINDVQNFCYNADENLIKSYISMLQSSGFTLVDTHVQEYKGSAFYSWGFTCDGAPNAEKIGLMYENTPCHVSLYYADDKGEYNMIVSKGILVCDTGTRSNGSRVDLSPRGTSAAAGLVKLADGSYQTSDGRLTASQGTAMVLRDGVSYTTDANYNVDGGSEVLKIENYYRNEGIYFEAPESSLMQGDIFTQRELRRWRWNNSSTMKGLESYRWGSVVLAMPKDGKWLGATYNDSVYESQTVRIMAYDPGGIAVFYIHSAFLGGEPREVEALCVVDTSQRSGNIENATYIKVGNTATLKYNHHEDGTTYETYEWKILEGSDKVSISGVGSSCDVYARAPGVAAVQVIYSYSKEEPDPLTGIMRTVGHSKTQQYTFIIE